MEEAKDAIRQIECLVGNCPDMIEKPRDVDVCYDILLHLDKTIDKIYKICREVKS